MDQCPNCGGQLKFIAAILEAPVIEKILTHLGLQARAPPLAPARGQALQAASRRPTETVPFRRPGAPGQLESAASAGLRERLNRPGDQGNPQTAPEKNDFRRRRQRSTDCSRLRRQNRAHQAPCSVVFGVPWR
jgi:hypothetical protein